MTSDSTTHTASSASDTAPTPSLSSPTATTTAASAGDHIYKGKYTNRSWQHLPPELVRAIATYYLLDVQVSNFCPLTWDAKELWHPRILYTTLRDANDLERLMQVTPSWAAALETHLFWSKACAALDPHDVLAHCAIIRPQPVPGGAGGAAGQPQAYRLTPFRHFRQMAARSCFVCRINSPYSSTGLAAAKRTHFAPHIGTIMLCREHRKTMFCGVCLREAPLAECDPQFDIHGNAVRFSGYTQPYGPAGHVNMGMTGYNPYASPLNPSLMVCCAENEDDETWPGIDTTCRSCRSEWLWRRIATSLRDREAVGGPRFVSGWMRSSSTHRQLAVSRYPPAKYASADWETRQTVDAFIELGEGSISEVLNVAREKFWLRSQTKMSELMEQAVAATRWAGEGMGVDFTPHHPVANTMVHGQSESCGPVSQETTVGNEVQSRSPINSTSPSPPAQRSRSPSPRSAYSSEYEGSEEEEDPELLSLTEDAGGVRELAISDWARTRILDGHWCNPADQWYGLAWPAGGGVRDAGDDTESEPESDEEIREGSSVRRTVRVPATHPCPWTISSSSSSHLPASDEMHPLLSTVRAQAPPSFGLCEQAHRAYQKQIKSILLPAMNNIVRRFVMECTNGTAGDPAVRAARMEPEDVLAELRKPGVWYDGVDWAVGVLGEMGDRERGRERGGEGEEDSASSASSRSDGSHTTSPVLSTSTLQTTPSPPPAHGEDKAKERTNESTRPRPPPVVPIPVSPILESPKLLHPIPYVPVTVAHMAQFSLDAFKFVWREACAPLFHCRCSICERAMINANAAAGNPTSVPTQAQAQNPVASEPQQQPQQQQRPPEVALEEVRHVLREQVVAEEEEEEEEELYEEEEEEESEDDSSISGNGDRNLEPPVNTHTITPRKRSSGDLEAENIASEGEVGIPRVGTPPKRARTGGHTVPPQSSRGSTAHPRREGSLAPTSVDSLATPRQRKRSSEELELSGSTSPSSTDSDNHVGSVQKRLRVEPSSNVKEASTTPRSLTASPPSSVTVVSSSEEEDKSKGFVDVGIGEGALKTGLVNGGELDGLYVFEG